MKRVIEKKVYDTKTATCIAEWYNGQNSGDFNFVSEDLYQTKKGAWFLVYYGGPNSCYAEIGQGYSSGSGGIIILTENEAYNWLEKRKKTEAIEKHFPDWIEEA